MRRASLVFALTAALPGCGVILFPVRLAVDATVEAVDFVTRDGVAWPTELPERRMH